MGEASLHGRAKYADLNHFYRRFEAEKIITNLAQKYSHSYHLGLFLCGKDNKIPDFKIFSAL